MVYTSAKPYGEKSDERKLLIFKEFLGSVGFQGGVGWRIDGFDPK